MYQAESQTVPNFSVYINKSTVQCCAKHAIDSLNCTCVFWPKQLLLAYISSTHANPFVPSTPGYAAKSKCNSKQAGQDEKRQVLWLKYNDLTRDSVGPAGINGLPRCCRSSCLVTVGTIECTREGTATTNNQSIQLIACTSSHFSLCIPDGVIRAANAHQVDCSSQCERSTLFHVAAWAI